MKVLSIFLLFALLCGGAFCAIGRVFLIDNYQVDSDPIVIIIKGPLPNSSSNFVVADSILGNERDLQLTATFGNNNLVLSAGVNTGVFTCAAPQGADGTVILQYDGEDNTAALDPAGLFAYPDNDFTINNAFAIRTNISADQPSTVFFKIYSGSSNDYCIFEQPIPAGNPKLYTINYVDFDDVGNGCDFSNVGAFEIEVDLTENVDILLDTVEVIADIPSPSKTPTRTPTRSPAPQSASNTRTPTRTRTPTNSPVFPSNSRTRTPTPTRTRTPSRIPNSPSRTPSPSSCICTCPELECYMFKFGEYTFPGTTGLTRNVNNGEALVAEENVNEEGFDFLNFF